MQKVYDLLNLPNLGSEKPSVLTDNIFSLRLMVSVFTTLILEP